VLVRRQTSESPRMKVHVSFRHAGTCLEINGTLSIDNGLAYRCECTVGFDGAHCELVADLCTGVVCENNGVCSSSYPTWSCRCLDPSLYSGQLCEVKSSSLSAKQALSKSFAFIAILAITGVFAFVITMDVLKYIFKIDPVARERQLIEWKRVGKPNATSSKKAKPRGKPKLAVRFLYIA
jgi:hypothetical protein